LRVERRRQLLQVDALAVLLVLARFLTLPTTHGKGHRTEPRRRDDLTTIDTVAVCARVEAAHRLVNCLQHLRLHLNEGEFQIVLGLGFDRLGQRRAVVVPAGSDLANNADPALNLIQQLAPTLH